MSSADGEYQGPQVLTVHGPVPSADIGTVLYVRALLALCPGVEFAPEADVDQTTLYGELDTFFAQVSTAGFTAVVDAGGMTLGRDIRLYQALSRRHGVHVIGSTGMAEERFVGSHFTNPASLYMSPSAPTQVDEIAELFRAEIEEGMAVPARVRSRPAGILSVGASRHGQTDFERLVYRAAGRAAIRTGASVWVRAASDPVGELAILVGEGLEPSRVVVGLGVGGDVAAAEKMSRAILDQGAVVAVHVDRGHLSYVDEGDAHPGDPDQHEEPMHLVVRLADAGYVDQLLVGSDGPGYAVGMPEFVSATNPTALVRRLRRTGATPELVSQVTAANPQRLLALTPVESCV